MKKFYSLIIFSKNYSGPFLTKKCGKKGFCWNGSLGLAWDHTEVSQVIPFYTTIMVHLSF